MTAWLAVFVVCVLAFTLAALVCDVRAMRMPNWLTVTAFGLALVYHLVVGAIDDGAYGALHHLKISLFGFALGFGVLFVPWIFGWGGGGDVKYMGALGAWLGFQPTVAVFLLAAIIGGIVLMGTFLYYLGTYGFSGTQRKLFPKHKGTTSQERAKRRLSPFAVPGAIATWLVIGWSVFDSSPILNSWQPQVTRVQPAPETQSSASAQWHASREG